MNHEPQQDPILLVRVFPRFGGGHLDVLHLDAEGREHPVRQCATGGPPDHDSPELMAVVRESMAAGITNVVFDLANMRWINSIALGRMMSWCMEIQEHGGRIVLADPHPTVANILEITDIASAVTVRVSVDEAVAYLTTINAQGDEG